MMHIFYKYTNPAMYSNIPPTLRWSPKEQAKRDKEVSDLPWTFKYFKFWTTSFVSVFYFIYCQSFHFK